MTHRGRLTSVCELGLKLGHAFLLLLFEDHINDFEHLHVFVSALLARCRRLLTLLRLHRHSVILGHLFDHSRAFLALLNVQLRLYHK